MRNLALLPVAIAVGLLWQVRPARAEGDKTTAEALFAEGRRLMAAGNYAAACPKFAASQKVDQGLGTSLNLADCYEKTGRTASAWAEYREAASTARSTGSKEREQFARSHAEALEKGLARLTLTASRAPADVRITRDGVAVDRGALGTAVPLDPGRHVIEAVAPGKTKWSVVIDVGQGAQLSIPVPELVNDTPGAAKTSAPPPPSDATPSTTGTWNTQRTLAIGAGVVGVAGIVVGAIFGANAKATWADAKNQCHDYPYDCGPGGVALGKDAENAAMVANIAMAVGIAGLAGGAALWFTAPSGHAQKPAAKGPVRIGVSNQRVLLRWDFQ
jgi:hypothetical protein